MFFDVVDMVNVVTCTRLPYQATLLASVIIALADARFELLVKFWRIGCIAIAVNIRWIDRPPNSLVPRWVSRSIKPWNKVSIVTVRELCRFALPIDGGNKSSTTTRAKYLRHRVPLSVLLDSMASLSLCGCYHVTSIFQNEMLVKE